KDALDLVPPEDRSTITTLVREGMKARYGLVLLEPFGLNNTYVFCVKQETAKRYGLRTLTDLKRAPGLRVVVEVSFMDRPDGWKGLVEKYGFQFDERPRQVQPDLRYKAIESDKADVVLGFATDWQIKDLNLVMLEDDKGYFPSYHGAPLVRQEVLERHPQIAEVLNRLKGKIADATIQRLNYQA